MEKRETGHAIMINLKCLLQHGVKNLNYQMDHVQYRISKITFNILKKKHSQNVESPSIRIYVNKIENRIAFKIKSRYYVDFLIPKTMKLLGTTESKITRDKNGEHVPHLEFVQLALVHCNLVNNNYQQLSRILYTFAPNKPFVNLLEISPTNHII